MTFLVFDVGGKVRTLWAHYYESLDALIFVIDSSDKSKLYAVKDELE
jgi:ADP-ribosylation factor protein 1